MVGSLMKRAVSFVAYRMSGRSSARYEARVTMERNWLASLASSGAPVYALLGRTPGVTTPLESTFSWSCAAMISTCLASASISAVALRCGVASDHREIRLKHITSLASPSGLVRSEHAVVLHPHVVLDIVEVLE